MKKFEWLRRCIFEIELKPVLSSEQMFTKAIRKFEIKVCGIFQVETNGEHWQTTFSG